MSQELWTKYYEAALDEGVSMFDAAQFADAALRGNVADAIDAAEYTLEDR